jgi:hypothetical protein
MEELLLWRPPAVLAIYCVLVAQSRTPSGHDELSRTDKAVKASAPRQGPLSYCQRQLGSTGTTRAGQGTSPSGSDYPGTNRRALCQRVD